MIDIKSIPPTWEKPTLKELAEFINGKTFSSKSWRKNGIPIIRIQNLKNDNSMFNYIDEKEKVERQFYINQGDLLYAWSGTPGTSFGVHIWKRQLAYLNQHIFKVIPFKGVEKKFLFYALNSLTSSFVDRAQGTAGLAHITKVELESTQCPLPPLKEQNRILDRLDELLSELEKGKEQLQTSLEQLKVYRQSILKHAFEGKLSDEWRRKQKKLKTPDELVAEIKAYRKQQYERQLKEYKAGKIRVKPKELKDFAPVSKKLSETFKTIPLTWFWTQINEISDNIAYGYTEKSSKEKIGPQFLRITDIQDNAVDWNTVPYCKIDKEKIGQYLLSKGDLVFARTGATVGKSFLIRKDPPDAVYASYLIRIRVYKIFIPEFMAYFFQSDFYWKQITEGQVGIGQPNVNGSKLSELFIPLMSQAEQDKIVQLLDNHMSNCDRLERTIIESINSTEVVKQGLFQKAFEGKLVEQDPADEPASVLLERIKNEREEFLEKEKERKKTEKPLHIKARKMAEELKRMMQILKESKEPVSTKILWQSSNHKDDIDDFYAALKKHIEAGEIIEMPRKGKESFLKLADTK